MINEYPRRGYTCTYIENEDPHNRVVVHVHELNGKRTIRQIRVRVHAGEYFAYDNPNEKPLACDAYVR